MSITLKATDVLTGTIHTNNPDTTETDVLEGKIHTLNETKIDSTLTKKGYAADAQTTGNEIANARLVATDVNDSGNIVLHHSGDETVEQGNDPIPLRAITLPGNSNKYVVVPEDTESKSYPGCFYRTDGVENEWVNPPMIPDTEYRTTERINGKAVYKKADAMGNIVYRLAGESAWVSYVDLVGGNTLVDLIGNLTITGGVYSSNHASAGKFSTTSSYRRSDYIPVKTGDILFYTNAKTASNFAIFAVYNSEKALTYARTTESAVRSGTYEITQDGYIVVSMLNAAIPGATMQMKVRRENSVFAWRKQLSILVIGNSFSQDSFAYLPPVLNSVLPDYGITYGVAYTSGASIYDQVNTNPAAKDEAAAVIARGLKYTYFNYWGADATKWDRQNMAKTFNDIMAMRKWDIIYLQPGGSSSSDAVIKKNIITPGRTIMRLLQELNGGSFSLMVGQHLAEGATSFNNLCNGMKRAKEWLGVVDTIPIGVAIENARTNATLKDIGEDEDDTGLGLLYDSHMQAGIPALIAAYTVALKILSVVGESHRGICGSTFVPTQEKCVEIGAGSSTGEVAMTHGYCEGVTDENIRMAQEIAVLAVNNPYVVTDCSSMT